MSYIKITRTIKITSTVPINVDTYPSLEDDSVAMTPEQVLWYERQRDFVDKLDEFDILLMDENTEFEPKAVTADTMNVAEFVEEIEILY